MEDSSGRSSTFPTPVRMGAIERDWKHRRKCTLSELHVTKEDALAVDFKFKRQFRRLIRGRYMCLLNNAVDRERARVCRDAFTKCYVDGGRKQATAGRTV